MSEPAARSRVRRRPGAVRRAHAAGGRPARRRDRGARRLLEAGVRHRVRHARWCRAWSTAGWATWAIEYRRGTGAADTLADVRAAIDALPDVDADTVVGIGHSAGGHLVTWAAGHGGLTHVVSQAGVLDLPGGVRRGARWRRVEVFLGHPPVRPRDVDVRLPLDVPVWCVHGTSDQFVPIEQSRVRRGARSAGPPSGRGRGRPPQRRRRCDRPEHRPLLARSGGHDGRGTAVRVRAVRRRVAAAGARVRPDAAEATIWAKASTGIDHCRPVRRSSPRLATGRAGDATSAVRSGSGDRDRPCASVWERLDLSARGRELGRRARCGTHPLGQAYGGVQHQVGHLRVGDGLRGRAAEGERGGLGQPGPRAPGVHPRGEQRLQQRRDVGPDLARRRSAGTPAPRRRPRPARPPAGGSARPCARRTGSRRPTPRAARPASRR